MTKLIYLEDTYQFNSEAVVTDIGTNEFGNYLILDQTIFYPQGGGQPTDLGFIYNENSRFEVTKCIFQDENVYHYGGNIAGMELQIGDKVVLAIDEDRRKLNARNHTAGHLIDLALAEVGMNLTPTKGFHFPEGPYVEYAGKIENTPEIISLLEQKLSEIISKNPKISFELAFDSKHPSGNPMRIIHMEGFPDCPCGGTHVDSLDKIGKITIRKIKSSGENTRIAYQVS